MTRNPSGLERRCAQQTGDTTAHAGQTALTCAHPKCGCVYLNHPAGHDAHLVVFGHAPQPLTPKEDDEPEGVSCAVVPG